MFRLLHTADWQMGMMARGLGVAAEAVREARLRSISKLLGEANARRVDAILAAGDQFEDNQVSPSVAEQVVGLLNDQTRIPIYIIPGNHDPCGRGSIYERTAWQQLRDHIFVLTKPEPVPLADGVTLFPCPLSRKHGMDDPTAWIPPRNGASGLRIGLAHGTMRIRDDVGDDDFPIPLDAAERHGLDYVALGHWHSALSSPCGRCWYSGTPETTKFGERDSGNALLVTLAAGGGTPKVEPVRTGVLSWLDEEVDVDRESITEMMRRLREREGGDSCLLRLGLSGQVSAATAAHIDDLRAMAGERFLYCRCDDARLRPPAAAELLGEMAGSPYLEKTAQHLMAIADGQVAVVDTSPAAARRALQLLQKAIWESRQS